MKQPKTVYLAFYEEQSHMYEVFLGAFSSREGAEKELNKVRQHNEDARMYGNVVELPLDCPLSGNGCNLYTANKSVK